MPEPGRVKKLVEAPDALAQRRRTAKIKASTRSRSGGGQRKSRHRRVISLPLEQGNFSEEQIGPDRGEQGARGHSTCSGKDRPRNGDKGRYAPPFPCIFRISGNPASETRSAKTAGTATSLEFSVSLPHVVRGNVVSCPVCLYWHFRGSHLRESGCCHDHVAYGVHRSSRPQHHHVCRTSSLTAQPDNILNCPRLLSRQNSQVRRPLTALSSTSSASWPE